MRTVQDPGSRRCTIKVLYLHHSGYYGGAGKSLLALLSGVSGSGVVPHVICQRGLMARAFEEGGFPVHRVIGLPQFDNTRYSYYRGWRWLVLTREFFYLAQALVGLLMSRGKVGRVDLVHMNEYTLLPAAIMARAIFRAPMVVHCRSLQRKVEESCRSRVIVHCYKLLKAKLVAIDLSVRSTLPRDIDVAVVHNSFDSMPGRTQHGEAFHRAAGQGLILGFVGQIGMMKGVVELLEAVGLCAERGIDVVLEIAGGFESSGARGLKGLALRAVKGTGDAEALIRGKVEKLGLAERVRFLGFMKDLSEVYRRMDVLCFTTRLNAPGRPIFEAAYYGKPSIVAMDRSWEDSVVDGVNGFVVRQNDPEAIYMAVRRFCDEPALVERMGRAARERAQSNHDPGMNASRMRDIYDRVLAEGEHCR